MGNDVVYDGGWYTDAEAEEDGRDRAELVDWRDQLEEEAKWEEDDEDR